MNNRMVFILTKIVFLLKQFFIVYVVSGQLFWSGLIPTSQANVTIDNPLRFSPYPSISLIRVLG